MSQEEDYITQFYRQRFIDYSLDPINRRFRWAVFWIVIMGAIGCFFKGFVAVWGAAALIFATWIFRRIQIQDARFEIAMEESRHRFNEAGDRIHNVYMAIAFIYGEQLGMTSEEGFDPVPFLWKRTGVIPDDN